MVHSKRMDKKNGWMDDQKHNAYVTN